VVNALDAGLVTVFVIVIAVTSTAGVTTIEFEPGAVVDLDAAFEALAPRGANDRPHSITIPFVQGKLALGTWQQVVLVEFDTRARSRQVVIQVVGE